MEINTEPGHFPLKAEPLYFVRRESKSYASIADALRDTGYLNPMKDAAHSAFMQHLDGGYLCDKYQAVVLDELRQDNNGLWLRDVEFSGILRSRD